MRSNINTVYYIASGNTMNMIHVDVSGHVPNDFHIVDLYFAHVYEYIVTVASMQ